MIKTYCGVADCYGIESFRPVDKQRQFICSIRAEANRQRHAVYYEVDVDEKQIEKMGKLIDKKDYEMALKYLKILKAKVPSGMMHSFNLIPNPQLDPYGKD